MLADLERQLEASLLEPDRLQRNRRQLSDPMARVQAGETIDELLLEIADLQQSIDRAPCVGLADAAVKLRRLNAHVGPGRASRLLGEALAAVERAAGG